MQSRKTFGQLLQPEFDAGDIVAIIAYIDTMKSL